MSHQPETGDTSWQLSPEDRDQLSARIFALVLEGYLEEFRDLGQRVRVGDDVEDLHQYRVVLRRTRSLLVGGQRVFPDEELSLLAAMATQLTAMTSPVRDLDVLSKGLDRHLDGVAERLHLGASDLRRELERARAEARDELVAALDGDFSAVLVRRWQAMASVYRIGGTESGPDALRPAGEVVDAVVWGTFRSLRRQGRRARSAERDADWHRLRKHLKRYRYLLSAFEDLYPPGTFSKVLRELAELQDGLGQLQDHVASIELLESAGLRAGGRAALLSGGLIDHLCGQTPGARHSCEQAWDRFDRKKVRRHLKEALSDDDQ